MKMFADKYLSDNPIGADVNPHSIADAIKLFLRELPDPLLKFDLYEDFIAVADLLPDEDQALEKAKGEC